VNLDIATNRQLYAAYLRGDGIEIGALDAPLRVLPERGRVRRVDELATPELRRAFPSVGEIVDVDVVCGADDLSPFADGSLDFIVANHVIEHLVNPLRTLELWRRKLRAGGVLFMAFPETRHGPDRIRPTTPVAHLFDEYSSGTDRTPDEHLLAFVLAWNPSLFRDRRDAEHLLRWMWDQGVTDLERVPAGLLGRNRDTVALLLREHRSDNIHQHVFTWDSMKELLARARAHIDLRFRLIDLSLTKGCLSEHLAILEATTEPGTADDLATPAALAAEERERFLAAWIEEKDRTLRQIQGAVGRRGRPALLGATRMGLARWLPTAVRARVARLAGRA
jgi:SAM-dependent methyltransferase